MNLVLRLKGLEIQDESMKEKKLLEWWWNDARRSDVEAVKEGLKKNINVNMLNKDGETALHCSSKCGDVAVTKALVEAGSNIHIANKDSETALDLAVEADDEETVKLLLKGIWYSDQIDKDKLWGEVKSLGMNSVLRLQGLEIPDETMGEERLVKMLCQAARKSDVESVKEALNYEWNYIV